MTDLLNVRDLHVEFRVAEGVIRAVRGISFRVRPGSTVALVGESGSGKSVVAQAIMGILPRPARITKGEILFSDPEFPQSHRHRQAGTGKQQDAVDPGRQHLDHLPGADDLAVAAPHRRQPGRRSGHAPPQRRQRPGARADRGHAAAGGFPRPEARGGHLPLRTVRRPPPARDDRDGADLPPVAADRGRADHRPRRHHPGADPEAAGRPSGRTRHGRADDHP